jgi:chaperonin GroES
MQDVDRGHHVEPLTLTVVEAALGPFDAAEVEAKGGDPCVRKCAEQRADDDRAHASAELRVRMGEDCGGCCFVGHLELAFQRQAVRRLQRHLLHAHARDATVGAVAAGESKQPIKMQSDRLLVQIPGTDGERKSRGGILIPATAQLSKRLVWAEVVAVGPHVRGVEPGDSVLFNPEDRYEVEVRGEEYLILRERDIHAVASERIEGGTGLYL